jgi:Tfp pilus assembly protein PilX
MLQKNQDEKGIALVVVIMMLLTFTVLGVAAINITNVGTKITSNTRTSKQAFYLAESGLERARELLRTQLVEGTSLSAMLATAANGGTLTNSTTNPSFSGSNNTPFVNTTILGAGSFKVYLTNDSGSCTPPASGNDSVTSTTDCNGTVTLTSIGSGPDNAVAIVQMTTTKNGGINLPDLPGAITLAGPDTVFLKGSSNASDISGVTHPAVAVNSAPAQTTVVNDIISNPDRSSNWTGAGGSPSVQNLVFGSPWDNISDLQTLFTKLKTNADYTSTGASGFTYGTTTNQKIVVIDGDLTVGPGSGAGILLVTGNLILDGNFNYSGIILAIGSGSITRNGGGSGTISGGIYVANIKGTDGQINTADDAFGNTAYDTSGGGSSSISYNSNTYSSSGSGNVINSIPFAKTSWKQY